MINFCSIFHPAQIWKRNKKLRSNSFWCYVDLFHIPKLPATTMSLPSSFVDHMLFYMLLRMHDFSNKIYSHKINSGDGHDSLKRLEPSVQFFFFFHFILYCSFLRIIFFRIIFFRIVFSNRFFPSAEEITKCINILFHIAMKKLYLRISK